MAWEIRAINFLPVFITKLKHHIPWVIVVSAFPFFFLGGPDESSTKLFGALWNCGHIVFFIALVFALNKKVDLSRWQYALFTLLAVFVGGGLIEVIQTYTGRDGNWDDLLRDLSGTCVGLFWLRPPSLSIWLGRVVALAFLIPSLSVVFFEAWYQHYAMSKFPLVAKFESSIELHGQKPTLRLSSQYRTEGRFSLQLPLTTERYSGISFRRLFNGWTGYSRLSFDIYNPESTVFSMSIRVNDVVHEQSGWRSDDRFNRDFLLKPGWNNLAFSIDEIKKGPKKRLMDLNNISLVVIFASQLPKERTIYLDNLRLE